MFLQFNALHSVLDDEFYFIFADNTCNFGVFVSVWQTVIFAERGAKRKKENLNYPVRDKNRKIIQQARENLPKDRLFRITQEDACVESAATKSVNLGKDSNFLGSQNFLRSSNHGGGVKHSARNRMLANFEGELGDASAKQVLSTTVLWNRCL